MISKEQIISTANDLFQKHGIKTITLDRITKELHTSKRTIYTHFSDKNQLLQACLFQYYVQVQHEHEQAIQSARNAIEAMGLINFHIHRRFTSANPSFMADLVTYYNDILRETYRETGYFTHRHLQELAKWGIRDGLFLPDMDVDVTVKTVLGLIEMLKDTDTFPIGEYSKKRLTFGVMLPYLRGVCTEKGIKLLDQQKDLFNVML